METPARHWRCIKRALAQEPFALSLSKCWFRAMLWDLREPAELAYWLGQRPACRVVRNGRIVETGA